MADSVPGKHLSNASITTKEKCKFYCDPCDEDGDTKEAEGFCVECQHYLCDQCLKYHCIPKPMKHHKLLGKTEMPKKKVDESLSEICPHHEDEMIKYYCTTHEAVGCNSCMIINHKPCQEICTLKDMAKDVEQSTAYIEFCARTKTAKKNLEDEANTMRRNRAISKFCKETALSEINELQKKINHQFELLRQQIATETKVKENNDTTKMKEVEHSTNDTHDALNNLREDIEILKETKQSKQLFIALHKSQEKLKNLEQKVVDIQKENKVEKYSFVPNKFLTSMLKNVDALGELCVQEDRESLGNLNSFHGNYPEYGMPKGTFISDETAIVLETIYNRIRLHSQSKQTVIAEKELTSCPWDITPISKNKFAITMPNEKKIKIMSVEDKNIKEDTDISIDARCEGIQYADNKLFVACNKPAKVLILDMNGAITISVSKDQAGEQLFKQPAYIVYDEEKQLICVSDRAAKCIVTITTEGKKPNVIRNEEWKMPLSVITSKNELVISDYDTLNVYKIDLTTSKITTEENDCFEFCKVFNKRQFFSFFGCNDINE